MRTGPAFEPWRPLRRPARSGWAPFVVLGVALGLLLALPGPLAARVLAPVSCKPQKAKDFLKRSSFVKHGALDGRANDRALRFRVDRYGRVEGQPFEERNPEKARSQAKTTRFFGLPVSVHRAIEPALRCVERRIRANCRRGKDVYQPHAVGGFRDTNTYRGGEVSNHLFGIAIDIDPDKNPCCGCVQPWPEHPACQAKGASIFERTALPMCWINAFERYGFYWLGRDPQLRDTMHFEYLADPEDLNPRER
jgi:hypothetical protein